VFSVLYISIYFTKKNENIYISFLFLLFLGIQTELYLMILFFNQYQKKKFRYVLQKAQDQDILECGKQERELGPFPSQRILLIV
jgi:hypothetical protein